MTVRTVIIVVWETRGRWGSWNAALSYFRNQFCILRGKLWLIVFFRHSIRPSESSATTMAAIPSWEPLLTALSANPFPVVNKRRLSSLLNAHHNSLLIGWIHLALYSGLLFVLTLYELHDWSRPLGFHFTVGGSATHRRFSWILLLFKVVGGKLKVLNLVLLQILQILLQ